MQIETFADKLRKVFAEGFSENKSLDPYIEKLRQKENLSSEEASMAARLLVSEKISENQQRTFLTAMRNKCPSVDEIAAFAYTLRRLAKPVKIRTKKWGKTLLGDTCGTGGGTLETFNISTTVMFILAAAGITVAKHGNRAVTSKCGSADVLKALGVNIDLEAGRVEECIEKIKIGFIYAPNFHKAFKNVQKVRKQLPFPTIFNVLGPLVNPAVSLENSKIRYSQVLGVNKPELTEKIAEVLKLLNVNRAVVVYGFNDRGEKGMDELSTLGKTKVSELKADGGIENYFLEPEQFGFKRANPEDLSGGMPLENAGILTDILQGKDRGPKRDIVLLNAAAGLYVGGKVKSIKKGIELAKKGIDSRRAYRKLEQLKNFSKKSV